MADKLVLEDVVLSALEIEGIFMADTDEHWSVASVGMAVARAQVCKMVTWLEDHLYEDAFSAKGPVSLSRGDWQALKKLAEDNRP